MTAEFLTALGITLTVLLVLNLLVWLMWTLIRRNWTRGETIAEKLEQFWVGLPPVAAAREKWPRAWRLLAGRLKANSFLGLPLTLIVLGAVYFIFLLGGLIEELLEAEELQRVDDAIFDVIDPLRTDGAIALYKWITHFGDLETLLAVSVVVAAMLAVHGPRRFILPLWVAVLGAQITSWSGKYLFLRHRPDFIVDVSVNSPSFPSGHATGSISVYLLLAYILSRDIEAPLQRMMTVYWLGALALTIAFSRVFLGVHYASDVGAGLLVGGFWVAVGVAISEILRVVAERRDRSGIEHHKPKDGQTR